MATRKGPDPKIGTKHKDICVRENGTNPDALETSVFGILLFSYITFFKLNLDFLIYIRQNKFGLKNVTFEINSEHCALYIMCFIDCARARKYI